ncbi:MAG: hypothetical protein ABIJ08_06975 [Nanoarchaeota archaeon]
MKKGVTLGILGLLIVSLALGAFAFNGKGNQAAREALETGNYASWKEAMTSELTEERFNQMKNMHSQMEERHAEMEGNRAEMDAAIEQGYAAWKSLVEETPRGNHMLEIVNEENFGTFVAMHEAKQNGDIETAKALADELGLEQPGCGLGKGIGHGKDRFMPNMPLE